MNLGGVPDLILKGWDLLGGEQDVRFVRVEVVLPVGDTGDRIPDVLGGELA